MTLTHLLDQSVTIKRLKTISGSRKGFVSTLTIDTHIQDLDDEEQIEYYGAMDATHKAWVDANSSIAEGDHVIGADGSRYVVVTINKKEYAFAMNTHQEVIMKKAKNNQS